MGMILPNKTTTTTAGLSPLPEQKLVDFTVTEEKIKDRCVNQRDLMA